MKTNFYLLKVGQAFNCHVNSIDAMKHLLVLLSFTLANLSSTHVKKLLFNYLYKLKIIQNKKE
jgi:hypothetical protein